MSSGKSDFSIQEMLALKQQQERLSELGDASAPPAAAPAATQADRDPQTTAERQGQFVVREARSVGGEEAGHRPDQIQFEHVITTLRRHIPLILFSVLFLPVVVGVIDIYLRDHIYAAHAQLERKRLTQAHSFQLGILDIVEPEIDIEDVSTLMSNATAAETLVPLLRREVERRRAALEAMEAGPRRAEKARLLSVLENMLPNEDDSTPPAAYSTYRGAISARNTSERGIQVTVRGLHPEVHRVMVRLMPDALNAAFRKRRRESLQQFQKELNNLYEYHRREIEAQEKQLAGINEQIAETDTELGVQFNRLDQLFKYEHGLRMEVLRQEAELAQLREAFDWPRRAPHFGMADEGDIRRVLVEENPLRLKWRERTERLKELVLRYTDEHPELSDLHNRIESVKAQMREAGQALEDGRLAPLPSEEEEEQLRDIQRVWDKLAVLRRQLRAVEAERHAETGAAAARSGAARQGQGSKQVGAFLEARRELLDRLSYLKRDDQTVYRALNYSRLLESQVQRERAFRVTTPPGPAHLESPVVPLDVTMAAIFGALIGCAMAFLLESVDTHLHSPLDVQYRLGLDCIGVIPHVSEKGLLPLEKPDHPLAEVYAHIRNNILYSRPNNPEKCLMVVSAVQGEGKSTISVNLCIGYALDGNRVLLIDSDLRRAQRDKPSNTLCEEEGLAGKAGLADYLSGEASLEAVIHETSIPGLAVLPVGKRVRSPSRYLGTGEMRELLHTVEGMFDIVIIDCPATLPVVDATRFSGHVRGVLFIVAAEDVHVGDARLALSRLTYVGSPVIGAVLNKIRRHGGSGYYYGSRYYGHQYYAYSRYKA